MPTDAVSFKLVDAKEITTATVTFPQDHSIIQIDYPETDSGKTDLVIVNELGQKQTYHLKYMEWHEPSEHSINNHLYRH